MRHDRILMDSSRYSRNRLGPGVYGAEYDARVESHALGSELLLRRLWRAHGPILAQLEAKGRQVVRP